MPDRRGPTFGWLADEQVSEVQLGGPWFLWGISSRAEHGLDVIWRAGWS
jgi:hypothetical protein